MGSKKVFAAAAALLLLTGCAGTVEETPDVQADAPAVEKVEAAPLELDAGDETESAPDTPEEAYLALVHEYDKRGATIANATDEQLIAAGKEACAQLAENPDVRAVRVVDGESPGESGYYEISSAIAGSAQETLCD